MARTVFVTSRGLQPRTAVATTVLVKGTADISNLTWQPYKGSIMIASLPDEFSTAQYPEQYPEPFQQWVMMVETRTGSKCPAGGHVITNDLVQNGKGQRVRLIHAVSGVNVF